MPTQILQTESSLKVKAKYLCGAALVAVLLPLSFVLLCVLSAMLLLGVCFART